MKKLLIICLVFLMSGCNSKNTLIEVKFNTDTYQIATPYKGPLTRSFVIDNSLNNYDPNVIEDDLTMLSTNYFKVNNSLFQNGQYLSENRIKELLSTNILNDFDGTLYFTAIHEQNYLSNSGNIKGISLSLVVNPYLSKKNENGTTTVIERNVDVNFIRKSADKLVREIRKNKEMENIEIVMGVFFLNGPSNLFPGKFKYIGTTMKSSIELSPISYEYHLLDDDYIAKNDIATYKMFESLEEQVKEINKSSTISGKAVYHNNSASKVEIEINGSFIKSETIYLANMIGDLIKTQANVTVDIMIIIKNNKEIEAIINKKSNEIITNIEILRG